MRLRITQDGRKLNELIFDSGPIYIGRHVGSQIFLPERGVSRKHAVIYEEDNGDWFVEDLDSSNKTFVNDNAVHKSPLNTGDTIGICGFKINVKLMELEKEPAKTPLQLDDTIAHKPASPSSEEIHAEIRNLHSKSAPMLKIPPKRLTELCKAIKCFERCDSIKNLHSEAMSILLSQLAGREAWVGLSDCHGDRFEIEGGRKVSSQRIGRDDLAALEYLEETLEKHHSILIPQLPRAAGGRVVRSVLIAPVLVERKCYGALYVNNSPMHEHYESEDLDYLTLLSVHIAVAVERICEFL
ncbi:type VI secretion system FHA domain protein [Anaerohalosphaera lusitana]|uniref:Type VI secretion system FHA domain protein n=1 Tax=Anaerohalosphaera lusitana TaxID=1936003 RepID=A0A1U9NQ87_9BACT|nr:FHA domain-containing protein [Anaerohalosphaera lusitana]AQT70102.1 type VI secretion system FHA domain protein [Anaerohalosphaera lusitana]